MITIMIFVDNKNDDRPDHQNNDDGDNHNNHDDADDDTK